MDGFRIAGRAAAGAAASAGAHPHSVSLLLSRSLSMSLSSLLAPTHSIRHVRPHRQFRPGKFTPAGGAGGNEAAEDASAFCAAEEPASAVGSRGATSNDCSAGWSTAADVEGGKQGAARSHTMLPGAMAAPCPTSRIAASSSTSSFPSQINLKDPATPVAAATRLRHAPRDSSGRTATRCSSDFPYCRTATSIPPTKI